MTKNIVLLTIISLLVFTTSQPLPITNILHEKEPIEIHVAVYYLNSPLFVRNYSVSYSQDQPTIQQPLQLQIPPDLQQNITIQASLYRLGQHQKYLLAHQTKNLTRYQRIRNKEQDSIFVSYDPVDQIESLGSKQQGNSTQQTKYDLHIPKNFHIMFVVNHLHFPSLSHIKPDHKLVLQEQLGRTVYLPQIDLGQLYIPVKRSALLQRGQTQNLTLHLFPQNYLKFLSFYSFGHPQEFAKVLGPMADLMTIKEQYMDEVKQMFFENPLWLVVLYFTLSFAEMFLKMAFIKSQLSFWKNIDKNKGVSLKTLFFQLFADVIFALYLYQYDANKMIIFFHFVDIGITLWKISSTYSLRIIKAPPFLKLQTSELYKKRQKIDNESIWYMNYVLFPLMALYLFYSLHKRDWVIKSYYKFLLETAVAFIGLFGFILMTPQLYINYKLQSVDHLNWRGLVCRFITTIIDDLFAFMVTMPPLRRIMYFRDDVIFLIYVYQRQIYKTDFSRKTIFTSDKPEEKQE